jgi:GT2 family glycosyltransferase
MPVRNGAELVEQAARSILEQTFADLELIVVDDGSEDETPGIIRRLQEQDGRVVLVSGDSDGIAAALNGGAAVARGRYLARMDADDLSLPRRLELQVEFLERTPEVGLVGGQLIITSITGSRSSAVFYPTSDAAIREMAGNASPFAHPAVTMRRELFDACGGYRATCPHAEDYDLWVRMLDRCRGANLRVPVLIYRVHSGQTIFRSWREQCLSTLAVRAAVRVGRAEGRDPLKGVDRVTEGMLGQLGVSENEIHAALAESLVSAANLAARVGERGERSRMLALAVSHLERGPVPSQTMVRLNLAQARHTIEKGARVRGLAGLARTAWMNPLAFTRLARAKLIGTGPARSLHLGRSLTDALAFRRHRSIGMACRENAGAVKLGVKSTLLE